MLAYAVCLTPLLTLEPCRMLLWKHATTALSQGATHKGVPVLQVMREQETGGKIFFIDGTGAWGNPTPQNVAYGAAKRAITQVKASASLPIFVHRCERRKSLSVCFNACPLQLSCLQLS